MSLFPTNQETIQQNRWYIDDTLRKISQNQEVSTEDLEVSASRHLHGLTKTTSSYVTVEFFLPVIFEVYRRNISKISLTDKI